MSILKFTNGKNRGIAALKKAIKYIMDSEKTSRDLISGNGVNVENPASDMETVQLLYKKAKGRSYVHYVISFDRFVSAELAYEIAEKCAQYYAEDYQYSLAVHENTANKHAHIILNTVNPHTGYKFSQSRNEMLNFRTFINQILKAYGLREIGKNSKQFIYQDVGVLSDDMDYEDLFEIDVPEDYSYDGEYGDETSGWWNDADEEECQLIAQAEEESSILKQIIGYFEGREQDLPEGVDYDDAEIAYDQWLESQQWQEDY